MEGLSDSQKESYEVTTLCPQSKRLQRLSTIPTIYIKQFHDRVIQDSMGISSFDRFWMQKDFLLRVFFEDSICQLAWLFPKERNLRVLASSLLSKQFVCDLKYLVESLYELGAIPALVATYQDEEIVFPLTPSKKLPKTGWETCKFDLKDYKIVYSGKEIQFKNKHQNFVTLRFTEYARIISLSPYKELISLLIRVKI